MRLVSLKLENFRQHRLSEIEFRDGMIAIVGPNGTGKTTVVEAILFALYGKKRGTKDDIRFLWSPGRQVAKVTLVFDLEGKRWTIERRESDAVLSLMVDDGQGPKVRHVATGISEVKAKVESLLRLTHDQFVNSFCAEQKALAFLADRSAQARQDEIAKMLGFDRLKTAADCAHEKRKALDGEARGLAQVLRDEQELVAAQKEAAAALKQVEADGMSLVEARKVLAAALEEARKLDANAAEWLALAGRLDELRTQGRELNRNLTELAAEEKKAAEEVAEFERLAPFAAEYESLVAREAAMTKAGEAYRRRLKAEQDVAATRKGIADLEADLQKAPAPDVEAAKKAVAGASERLAAARLAHRNALDAWNEAKKAASNTATEARTRFQAAKASLDKMRDLVRQGKCPTCGQVIGEDVGAHLREHEAELAALEAAVATAIEAVKASERPPDSVAKSEAEERAADAAWKESQSAHEDVSKRHSARTERLERVRAERQRLAALEQGLGEPVEYDDTAHRTCQARLEELRPLRDRRLTFAGAGERLAANRESQRLRRKEFDELRAESDKILLQQKSLGFETRDAAEAARQAFHARDTELKLKDQEIASHGERVNRAKEDVERAKQDIAQNRERKARHDTVVSESKHLQQTRQELLQLRENLNQELRPQLEQKASDNLDLLTAGRYRVLRLDEDFAPTVVEDDDKVKAVISGGEEDVVALSLRLALSELIQERHGMPMTLLILDEVFGSLDAERRQHVMDRLAALKTRFTQMLVISHIEEINQVADRCLYLKRDPESRATLLTDAPPEMALDVLDFGGSPDA